MHNGNPKLTCNDETCRQCQQVFKGVVQPLPRYTYICDKCSENIKNESKIQQIKDLEDREQKLQQNRDYVAKYLGWSMTEDMRWKHFEKNIIQDEHPIATNLKTAKSLVPFDWSIQYDDIYMVAYKIKNDQLDTGSSKYDKDNMIVIPTTGYYSMITGESEDCAKMHDYYNILVKIIEYIHNEKENKS